jgi:hypothetical protein
MSTEYRARAFMARQCNERAHINRGYSSGRAQSPPRHARTALEAVPHALMKRRPTMTDTPLESSEQHGGPPCIIRTRRGLLVSSEQRRTPLVSSKLHGNPPRIVRARGGPPCIVKTMGDTHCRNRTRVAAHARNILDSSPESKILYPLNRQNNAKAHPPQRRIGHSPMYTTSWSPIQNPKSKIPWTPP